ncbi:Peptidase S10, serine carboxypeptidase [Candidatus Sulfopaludibacter sp. SbA3]|nr:Peptidase S10, serine carboxypeptidase [Candidatus Sulfopaludibacter sp. SbA3]
MRVHLRLSIFLILIAATAAGAYAQGRGRGAATGATNDFYRFNYNSEEGMQQIRYPEQPITTQHQITLHGETIAYTAHAGFIPIRQATSGATRGHLFYIYYSKNGVTDRSKRPVWFLFNGGPGAATVWLHMGAFGPKMVKMAPNGLATPPPYTYVDNPNCLLDTGDLVFIDAMGTGFSRPDQPQFGPEFGGVENDLAAFGEFIRSFLNEYNLWGSPLFVGGESYGTTRAAGLAGYLTDHDIPINGVMLLSAVIDSNAAAGEQRQLSTLPTEIMTAHFHKKLPPDLQKLTVDQIAKQARDFASGEYLEYLFDGARATQAQRDKVLADMARFTGLSKSYIDGLDLRVPLGPFSTELLRDQHLMTSRLDSRFAGYQLDGGATNTSFDYSNANIEDCFLTAFESYVRNDLNYKNDNLYYVAGNAPPWSGEYNTVVNLEDGFAKNPHMHLFVGMGYYDFACPFYPVEWTIAHLKASDEIKKNNISLGYYESGHMVYIDQPAAAKYHADLVKFVQASLPK